MKYFAVFMMVFVFTGCTKDKTQAPATPKVFVCDSTVTYTSAVKKIMDTKCALPSCHLGINSSGIYLDNYNNTKISFNPGNAYCTIQHGGNCKEMPYPAGSAKLSDSLINIISCWVGNGLPQYAGIDCSHQQATSSITRKLS